MDNKSCIFCEIAKGKVPSLKIYEDKKVLAFLDINPANLGHTLIIPKRHYNDIYSIPEEDLSHLIKIVKRLSIQYKDIFGIKAVNLINSNGTEAQQDVFHFHIHLIPRNKDDKIKFFWINRKKDLQEKSKEFEDKFRKLT